MSQEITLKTIVEDFKNHLGYTIGQTILSAMFTVTDKANKVRGKEPMSQEFKNLTNKYKDHGCKKFLYEVTDEELLTLLQIAIKDERE